MSNGGSDIDYQARKYMMRFSFSHKLFAGFSLLSLLTILLGVTTFTTINEITRGQRNLALLQEFELRVNTLETAANSQSNVAFISAKSYEDFRENLDRTRQLAEEILHSDYCESGPNPDGADSCQAIMLEAMDFYPRAAIEHYEKTLLTLRLINQNHFIYRKMLEAEKPRPEKVDHSQINNTIHQLEMLKHEFEESNDFAVIEEMKSRFEFLGNLDPNAELLDLAEIFVANSEQTYRNRLEIMATREGLAETTERFRATAQNLLEDVVSGGKQDEQEVRTLIIFLGTGSIALTLLFWLLTSSRLARFMKNQKKAINSIKTGHYDYPVEKDTNDELHELYLFTKDLAENLKEEIAEREFSQQEKKDLEFQLMQAQRLESIGILAGGIAHDFNNVLTGITGYTELAMARLDDNHPVKKYLETIADSGQKAVEMTRQLLVFSHKQETAKRVINLNMLITNLMKMLDRMIGENIVLVLDPAPELPAVMADPAHIEHVLLNLA
ncbi:MAG: sensor histidine kinase, partial [Desulfurivibrionaceae bacterium]